MVWFLNILIPGCGLIVLKREWLGFFVAAFFGLCGNAALAGWLIAPDALPKWLVVFIALVTAATWIGAQLLLASRQRDIVRRQEGLSRILLDARNALDTGNLDSARAHLENGCDLDEESVEWHVLWARVCTRDGDLVAGQQAWSRVLKLDIQRQYHSEARQALQTNA